MTYYKRVLIISVLLLLTSSNFNFVFAEDSNETNAAITDASTNAELLPENLPIVPVLVYQPEHTYAKRFFLSLGPSYLEGDKYLDTKGISGEVFYFFTETLGVLGGFFYSASTSAGSNAKQLITQEITPIAHNPSYIFYSSFVYAPFYGKFSLGSYLQKFKIITEAGFHAAQESTSNEVQEEIKKSATIFGINFGLGVWLPIWKSFSTAARTQYFLHGKLLENEAKGRNNLLYSLQLNYGF